MKTRPLLIVAGGTGGHVFPALAVAERLRAEGVRVCWLGTQAGIESHCVPKHAVEFYTIPISGLRGKGFRQLLRLPLKMMYSFFKTVQLLRRLRPAVVLGMGGFVSGPGGLAAFFMRIPLVIHEQNAITGLTNRWLQPLATRVLHSFPITFTASAQVAKRPKIYCVGNPVRAELCDLPPPPERYAQSHTELRILVLGGSQGSVRFNQVIPAALQQFAAERALAVWHQTGRHHPDQIKDYYAAHGIVARVDSFIDQMAAAYTWADIVICRAGATTLAELTAVGVPSILIPYPFASDNHQLVNARYLVSQGASVLLEQTQLSVDTLVAVIRATCQAELLLSMANAAYRLRRIDATQLVAQHCQDFLCNTR